MNRRLPAAAAGAAAALAAIGVVAGLGSSSAGASGGPLPNSTFYLTERFSAAVSKVTTDSSGSATVNNGWLTGLPSRGPDGIVFDHHGNLFIGNTDTGTISEIDPATATVTKSQVNTTLITNVADLALAPNADVLWTIGWNTSNLDTVSLPGGAVTSKNPDALTGLDGIALNGDGTRVFVASRATDKVYEISPSTGHVVRSLQLTTGSQPDGMTFDTSTGELYVALDAGAAIAVVATGTDAVPVLTFVKDDTSTKGDGIVTDDNGHALVVNDKVSPQELDYLTVATDTSTKIAGAGTGNWDDVAPIAGAGAPPTPSPSPSPSSSATPTASALPVPPTGGAASSGTTPTGAMLTIAGMGVLVLALTGLVEWRRSGGRLPPP